MRGVFSSSRRARRHRSPDIEDLVNPRKRFVHGDAYDPADDAFAGAPGYEFRAAAAAAEEVAQGELDGLADAVPAEAGEDRVVVADPRPTRAMQDLSRLQDIGDSNQFAVVNIRGGLPNFKLLDYLDNHDTKYCVTTYMLHHGGVPPTDPGQYVLPFTAGKVNYIDPIASSCEWLREFTKEAGTSTLLGAKRIYYYALNAVSRSVAFNTWWSDIATPPPYQFYGFPRPAYLDNYDAAPRPELICLPDPEHCIAAGAQTIFQPYGAPVTYNYANARTNWPYDEIYHRESDAIVQSRIRISGVVSCSKYYTRVPIHASYIGTDLNVESSLWQERLRFCRPVVVVVLFLNKDTNGHRVDFDAVVDAYGFDALTPHNAFPLDANLQNWTPTVPRFYAEQDSHCRILAYEVIDMSDTVPVDAVKVETIYQQETSFNPGIAAGEQAPYEIEGVHGIDYQMINVPYSEKRFVMDVDLNNLVTRFTKGHWDYITGSGSPDFLATEFGVDMIADNSLHIAAYAYYPGFPLSYGYQSAENPPSADNPNYRQPASIGYTSHLSFQDFKD